MAFWQFFFHTRDPKEIVLTRSGQGVRFRLPNQLPERDAWSPLVFVVLSIGSYLLFVFIHGTLRYPEEERDYPGMFLGVFITLFFMAASCFRWRIAWHYELLLSADDLRVYYVSSRTRYLTAQIGLESVQQFTMVQKDDQGGLQAETLHDGPRIILRSGEPAPLLHLAHLLAAECRMMAPERAAIGVASELARQQEDAVTPDLVSPESHGSVDQAAGDQASATLPAEKP